MALNVITVTVSDFAIKEGLRSRGIEEPTDEMIKDVVDTMQSMVASELGNTKTRAVDEYVDYITDRGVLA